MHRQSVSLRSWSQSSYPDVQTFLRGEAGDVRHRPGVARSCRQAISIRAGRERKQKGAAPSAPGYPVCGKKQPLIVSNESKLTGKPGSVVDSHSSRPAIAHWLKQPTRVQYGPYLVNPYLALLRVEFTVPRTVASRAVRSYRTLSPLPDPVNGPSAVCSLLHWS